MKPQAFIFDLDGVITDTAHFHYMAWQQLAKTLDLSFTKKDNEKLKGVSRIKSFEIILEVNNAQNRFTQEQKEYYSNIKNEIYKNLITQLTPQDILSGVNEFLKDAKQNNIKLAVASASHNVFTVLNLLGLTEEFDYIANPANIKNTKPDPEVFLDCAKALSVNPEFCVGFEDAQAGIEAIKKAKMFAVGINVDVTTEKPDLSLVSTSELNFEKVVQACNL